MFQGGCAIGGYQIQSLEWFIVQVRRLVLDHFNGHDAQRPDIYLGVIFLLLDHFRGHLQKKKKKKKCERRVCVREGRIFYPIRRAHHGRPFPFLIGQFCTKAKITDLDMSLKVEQDIVRLDITMDDVLSMQMMEAGCCLYIYIKKSDLKK
jgi:hypothetical protein